MAEGILSVRELQEKDIELITGYWLNADAAFLAGMGVDLNKMPTHDQWIEMLSGQLGVIYNEKKSYGIIWEEDGIQIGHCNVTPIIFGQEAFMHLHLWNGKLRKRGTGTELVKMSLHYFFKNLQLKRIFSEPYALNAAPNKTLPKAGFEFVKEYITTPGYLNFEQPVNRWELSYDKYSSLHETKQS